MNLKIYLSLLAIFACFGKLVAQSNFSSELPLIYINTNGQVIQDEPKIIANMGIIWNDDGQQNKTGGEFNHFNGKIGIEIRGSSSQMFPKKSYGFELRDENGEGMDFPLLDLPEEEDWILYAPYSDKTLIRNVLTFTLAGQLDEYAPRCRFVELFLNNKYEGVYVLMEKIKRDKNRVDIAKLKPDDLAGEDLTGGYIIKIDKTTGSGGSGWHSDFPNKMSTYTYYQYEYPAYDEIHDVQANYIKKYVHDFEEAVYYQEYDPETGYQQYININSFIDYMIINEIAKNVDGYRLSTFLYKDKDGKLNAGPVWDFNLGYGNADYYNGWETFGLQVYANLGSDSWQNPFWWGMLLGDRYFTKALRCRWNDLHEDLLSTNRIIEVADSLVTLLEKPIERNFQRWPILGQYVWPNYYVGQDYLADISWMKNWIIERMRSLHLTLPGDCDSDPMVPLEFAVSTFPNPFTSKFTVQIASDKNLNVRFELFTINGKKVVDHFKSIEPGLNTIEMNTEGLAKGVYIYRLFKADVEIEVGKIVKM